MSEEPEPIFVVLVIVVSVILLVVIYSVLESKARACVERGGTVIYVSGSYFGCVEKK